jgi:hypothetical protein
VEPEKIGGFIRAYSETTYAYGGRIGLRWHNNNMTESKENQVETAEVLALENELALDNDGWALLAPYGEHRKTRTVEKDGQVVDETYAQVFDEAAVDAVIADEQGSGILSRIKRALIKRPIYNGHPDIRLYAPETVTAGNDRLTPLGVNDALRKTGRGLEFKPLLVPAGAKAVEDGCKYPSGLFLLRKTGRARADGAIEVTPFRLASVGLTAHPNISGVDSLANQAVPGPIRGGANTPAAGNKKQETKEEQMKSLIIGWLAARGVALANESSEQAVFDAFLKENTKRDSDATALGNEKVTLGASVQSPTADRATLDAAQKLAKMDIEDRMSQPANGRRAMINGGGPNAGKSSMVQALAEHFPDLNPAVTYDNTLRNYEFADKLITKGVANGWEIVIPFVWRPMDQVFTHSLKRTNRIGRGNKLAELPEAHRKAQRVFTALYEKWKNHPQVKFLAYVNDREGMPARDVNPQEIIDKSSKTHHIDTEGGIRNEQDSAKRIYQQAQRSGEFHAEHLERDGEPEWNEPGYDQTASNPGRIRSGNHPSSDQRALGSEDLGKPEFSLRDEYLPTDEERAAANTRQRPWKEVYKEFSDLLDRHKQLVDWDAGRGKPEGMSHKEVRQLMANATAEYALLRAELILMRVQVATNNPRPGADAPHPVAICRQPWQAGFQGAHHPGHV